MSMPSSQAMMANQTKINQTTHKLTNNFNSDAIFTGCALSYVFCHGFNELELLLLCNQILAWDICWPLCRNSPPSIMFACHIFFLIPQARIPQILERPVQFQNGCAPKPLHQQFVLAVRAFHTRFIGMKHSRFIRTKHSRFIHMEQTRFIRMKHQPFHTCETSDVSYVSFVSNNSFFVTRLRQARIMTQMLLFCWRRKFGASFSQGSRKVSITTINEIEQQ